jgi:hypothetical protein
MFSSFVAWLKIRARAIADRAFVPTERVDLTPAFRPPGYRQSNGPSAGEHRGRPWDYAGSARHDSQIAIRGLFPASGGVSLGTRQLIANGQPDAIGLD